MVALVIACVAGVVTAMTGTVNPVSALQFVLQGHWVFTESLGSAFHVDGATGAVDARAHVPGSQGDQVFQGDSSGYVVGRSRVTEFGRSSLEVVDSSTPPSREPPVGVETTGGPYLVYREDGKVVRLGDPHAVLSLGGPVGMPLATEDGTVWLPRTGAGLLCRLQSGAGHVSCPILLPRGHSGGLSTVGDQVVFVDTTDDTVHVVEEDGLGEGRATGVDLSDDARFATTTVGRRIAVVDGTRLHLLDADLDRRTDRREPVTVELGNGNVTAPVSTGAVVAVVNLDTRTLMTFDDRGERTLSRDLPDENGDPRVTRGDDGRIYVDGEEGRHVMVVDRDGDLTEVPIDERAERGKTDTAPEADDPAGEVVAGPKPATPPDVRPRQPNPSAGDQPGGSAPERTRQPTPPSPPVEPPPVEPPPVRPPPVDPPPVEPPPVVEPTVPGAPPAVRATAGNATATVTWQAAQDNRSAITGYEITWPAGRTTAGPGDRRATISGLTNGTGYVFTVRAVNAVGPGPGVATNPVTPVEPFRPASEPTDFQIVFDYDADQATLSWNPPADLGGGRLVHYLVEINGAPEPAVTGQSLTIRLSGSFLPEYCAVLAVTENAAGKRLHGAQAAGTVEELEPNGRRPNGEGP